MYNTPSDLTKSNFSKFISIENPWFDFEIAFKNDKMKESKHRDFWNKIMIHKILNFHFQRFI